MPLTVLMPAYNSGEFIKKSIQSILSQTYADFELLIVDDGSTDSTADLITRFSDSRIRLLRKNHTGLGDSLNTGLKEAKFDLIARLDSDDLAMPDRLKYQTEFLQSHKDADIISSSYYIFKNKKILYKIVNPLKPEEIRNNLKVHSCIAHSGCMYYRKKILDAGGYSDGAMEDYDLWLRLRNQAVFYNIADVLTLVRYRSESLSWHDMKKNKITHKAIQDRYLSVYDGAENDNLLLLSARNELHYGSVKKSRLLFSRSGKFKSLKIFILYLFTFLPEKTATKILELRIKERLLNAFIMFSAEKKKAHKLINSL